jgi:phage major head subunit gpT-like protein
MPANNIVNLFTAAMQSKFINAYEATAEVAPIEKALEVLPSSARIENYAWLSPTPAIAQYKGHRRFGNIGGINYRVENLEYDASFEVLMRDVEDDQVGGYMKKPAELAEKAKKFPNRLALTALSANSTCFDGTAFFADSHTIGSGDNNLAKDCASNDGVTHYLYALVVNKAIKPLVYQDRKPPRMETDADTKEALKTKVARYWVDMEGAIAYGHWWDAVKVTITDTPTVTEVQSIFADVETALRGFTLPKNLTADAAEYPNEQLEFTPNNVLFCCSTKIANLVRTVLQSDTIVSGSAAITNIYKGFGSLCVSAILN